jgi:hypothetical protein
MKHPSYAREEERCGDDWSFPPLTYVREEERCDNGWNIPPYDVREERYGSKEKQTSRSDLGSASSRALNAC